MERRSGVSGSSKKKQKTKTKFTVKGKAPQKLLEQAEWHSTEFLECQENEGMNGPYLTWVFEVTRGTLDDGESDAKGVQLRINTGQDIRPGNSGWWVVTRLLGTEEFEENDDIDISSCKGKKYRVMIEHKPKKGDPETVYNDIKMLKKLVPKKKTTKRASQ